MPVYDRAMADHHHATPDAHGPPQPAEPMVLLTVLRDEDTAQHWRDALEEAGIVAELTIEDGSYLSPTSSMYPTRMHFVFPLRVPADQRRPAAELLIDLGWDGGGGERGNHLDPRTVLRGALLAGLGVLAFAVLVAVRGG